MDNTIQYNTAANFYPGNNMQKLSLFLKQFVSILATPITTLPHHNDKHLLLLVALIMVNSRVISVGIRFALKTLNRNKLMKVKDYKTVNGRMDATIPRRGKVNNSRNTGLAPQPDDQRDG